MPFFGGFTQGLAGGLQAGQQMKMQAEEHKLKARMLQFQADKLEADQKAKQDQQTQLGSLANMVANGLPGQPPAPLEPGQEGPSPAPDFQIPNRPATQGEIQGGMLKAAGPSHVYQVMDKILSTGGTAAAPKFHVVGGNLVDETGKAVFTAPPPVETPYQKGQLDVRNKAVDAQIANTQAQQAATAAQRQFTNSMAQQAAADRQTRMAQAADRAQNLDENRKLTLYQQALKLKTANEPSAIRRFAEALGWPAPQSREEVNAMVDAYRPAGVPGAPATTPTPGPAPKAGAPAKETPEQRVQRLLRQ